LYNSSFPQEEEEEEEEEEASVDDLLRKDIQSL